MHTLSYGCRLDTKHLCHLRRRHFLEVAQDECIAISVGQLRDNRTRLPGERVTIDQFVRRTTSRHPNEIDPLQEGGLAELTERHQRTDVVQQGLQKPPLGRRALE